MIDLTPSQHYPSTRGPRQHLTRAGHPPQMVRAGLGLNLLFIALITALAYTVMAWVFGVQLGVVPSWAAL
ncbi:MAG: hypothetical protein ACOCVZ_08080 [Gemmatimonadota bacterium]